ncbi:MAG TPA: hypothetical protein VHF89_04735 [Solirubrobacteraceae bacterium]|nr:hypothetical protein [Solirubrobacteraceae bacterium]
MNPLDPVKWGAQAAFAVGSTAVKIGMNAVRTAELLLGRNDGDDDEHRYSAVATPVDRDRETPGSATRGHRAPDPTSAAGASRSVAGTADAPGDAAAAGAPDPTAVASPGIPRGHRRQNDLRPPAPGHVDEEPDAVVESEGAADPGATLRVDAPFEGYDQLRAQEIVARVRRSDDATKAVVRLYEQTHKKRKSVLAATE